MNEMIERVAEALRFCNGSSYLDMSRAAIAAMREPTDSMLDAGEDSTYEPSSDRPYIGHFALKFAWYAMIDKALAEK